MDNDNLHIAFRVNVSHIFIYYKFYAASQTSHLANMKNANEFYGTICVLHFNTCMSSKLGKEKINYYAWKHKTQINIVTQRSHPYTMCYIPIVQS